MADTDLDLNAIEAYAQNAFPQGGERRMLAEHILDVIQVVRNLEASGSGLRVDRMRKDADATLRDLLTKIGFRGSV